MHGLLLDIPVLLWRPAGPPVWIVTGGVLLSVLAAVVYARTFRARPVLSTALLAVRLGLVIALCVVLMGPSALPAGRRVEMRSRVAILLDTSASMTTADCSGTSRIRFAADRWLADERLAELSIHHDYELFGFDEDVRPLSARWLDRDDEALAAGGSTDLDHALTQVLARDVGRGEDRQIVVIGDGHDTVEALPDAAARLARSGAVPIHTVCLGGGTVRRDLAVVAMPMQDFLLANEPGSIVVRVYQTGFDYAQTRLRFRAGDEVRDFPIAFNGRTVIEVEVPVREETPGEHRYHVSLPTVEGEVELRNNEQSVFCDVSDERIDVLILEGQPFWDTKFLAQSLRRDERIEMTQISQLSRGKQETIVTRTTEEDRTPRPPRTEEEFAAYDVIILGRGIEHVLTEESAELLRRYVSDGGGRLVMARGRAYDATTRGGVQVGRSLEQLEPVVWGSGDVEGTELALTAHGRDSSWLSAEHLEIDLDEALSRLPGFTVMERVEREKPATLVLARARPAGTRPGSEDEGDPALVTMSYGRGTVAAVLGEGLWQWSLLAREQREFEGLYDAFWSNLVRWLAMGGDFQPGREVAIKLSRRSVRIGDPLTVDVVTRSPIADDHGFALALTDPDGVTTDVPLHGVTGNERAVRGGIAPEATGVHRLVLHVPGAEPEEREVRFTAYDLDFERLESSARPSVLRFLAEETGGMVLEPNEAGDLVRRLERRRTASQVPEEPVYLWNEAVILVLILTWAGMEWVGRRMGGLL